VTLVGCGASRSAHPSTPASEVEVEDFAAQLVAEARKHLLEGERIDLEAVAPVEDRDR
jgi:hypothetical protein